MLKTEGVYQFDTQRDMLNNLIGAGLAVALYAWNRRVRRAGADHSNEKAPAPAGAGASIAT
jgi:hypothetical protein